MTSIIHHQEDGYPYFSGTPLYKVKGGFNFLYDGFMSIAVELVKIVHNSKGFTIRKYPGQEVLYNNFFNNIDYLRDQIDKIIEEGNPDNITQDDLDCLEQIYTVLQLRAEDGLLDYTYMLAGYIAFMERTSVNHDILESKYSEYLPRCNGGVDLNKYIGYLSGFSMPIVPFVASKGAFGVNTFLYLYFNNLFPAGISKDIQPASVHEGVYNTQLDVTFHDISHLGAMTPWNDSLSYSRYIGIMENQEEYGRFKVMAFLFIIFMEIHEYPLSNVPVQLFSFYISDYIKFFLTNDYYNDKVQQEYNIRVPTLDNWRTYNDEELIRYMALCYKLMVEDFVHTFGYETKEGFDYNLIISDIDDEFS